MINKVQPVNNTLDYWHKYRPWAHKYLNHYTKDQDLHGNLDSELWFLLKRILNNVRDYKTLGNYIKDSIRGIAKRIKDRLGYKYGKHDLSLEKIDYDKLKPVELNVTLDEYLERKALLKYIDRLSEKQAIVIKKYFGIAPYSKTTLKKLGEEMGVSGVMVRLIKEAALKRLKSMMNNKGIYNIEDFIYG